MVGSVHTVGTPLIPWTCPAWGEDWEPSGHSLSNVASEVP